MVLQDTSQTLVIPSSKAGSYFSMWITIVVQQCILMQMLLVLMYAAVYMLLYAEFCEAVRWCEQEEGPPLGSDSLLGLMNWLHAWTQRLAN